MLVKLITEDPFWEMKSEVNLIEMLKPFLEKSPNEMLMN
jgi:hypothetical protein